MSHFKPAVDHLLHPGYSHPLLHKWHSPGKITPDSLMYPLFVTDDDNAMQPIGAMPGQYRWGVNRLEEALGEAVKNGLTSIILFGVLGVRKPGNLTEDATITEHVPHSACISFVCRTEL
jgi:porphobilinogen synthase